MLLHLQFGYLAKLQQASFFEQRLLDRIAASCIAASCIAAGRASLHYSVLCRTRIAVSCRQRAS